MSVKWTLFGLCGMSVKLQAQSELTMVALMPILKTGIVASEVEKSLLQRGFVLKPGVSTAKDRLFQGHVDSGLVQLTMRKVSKKGSVWRYRVVFVSNQSTWLQKKADFEQKLLQLNSVLETNPSNTTKTLPQYCAGKEAQCFKDGISKYQSSWYWNNAVQRIKTVELKINSNYETVIEITDNAQETHHQLN
jgi:hypothetical protein